MSMQMEVTPCGGRDISALTHDWANPDSVLLELLPQVLVTQLHDIHLGRQRLVRFPRGFLSGPQQQSPA